MTSTTGAEENLRLIMTCLKYTEPRTKPDFDAAAAELDIDPKKLYHRHWSLLKKWGMTGSRAADAGSAAGTTMPAEAPATPKGKGKRGRAKTETTTSSSFTTPPDDNGGDDGSQAARATPKPKTKKKSKEKVESDDEINGVNGSEEAKDGHHEIVKDEAEEASPSKKVKHEAMVMVD